MDRVVATVQGAYYLVSGLWPLASMRTFERVTGPKVDDWLVRMVGLLAAVIGSVLLLRAMRPGARGGPDPVLGVASAAAFAAIDVTYGGRGRISRVYLADAVAQVALVAGWLASRRR